MEKLKERWLVIAGVIAAIAAIISNFDTIENFMYKLFTRDSELSLEIADINHTGVVWSSNQKETGEKSYTANFLVKKNGRDALTDCNFDININNSFISESDNTNRKLDRGPVSLNWHYEHKVKTKDFYPDVTIQLECKGFNSNVLKLKF